MDDLYEDDVVQSKQVDEVKTSTQPSTDSTQPQRGANLQLQKHAKSSAVYYNLTSPLEPALLDDELVLSQMRKSSFSSIQLSRLIEQSRHQEKIIKELFQKLQEKSQLNEIYQNFIRDKFRYLETAVQGQNEKISQALKDCFFNKPLLVLCFASPLIRMMRDKDGIERAVPMPLIDYQKEFDGVKQALSNTDSVIQVKQIFGSKERFDHVQTENPIGLHFSGHSVQIRRPTVFNQLKNDDFCVLFEKNDGEANLISPSMLSVCKSLKFVFFATCHSESAGSIFHNAGVQHVVCITQKSQILDEAAIFFSKNFYELVFKGVLTICESFQKAQQMIKTHEDKIISQEAGKFKLLVKIPHQCEILGPYPQGKIEEIKSPVKFPFEVAKADDFVGRQEDMFKIAKMLTHNRLITIRGLPGIGKTSISKRLGYFLSEREIFKDGVIFISMRGKNQASSLIESLFQYLLRVRREIVEEKQLQTQQSMERIIFEILSGTTSLLIIDNIEEVLYRDHSNFRHFLQILLERIPHLTIMSTSRESVGNLDDISEVVYNLEQLSNEYTFQLLEQKSRKFSEEEKSELENTSSEKLGVYGLRKKQPEKFYDHPLFDIFAGHPYTVSLVAPLLQDKTNSLSVIYKKLSQMINSSDIVSQNSINPLHSLRNSIKASVEQVQILQPLAIQLFCLIGLLPAGLAENDLSKLWELRQPISNDWVSLVETLKKYSLIVQKQETQSQITYKQQKYYLLPFMCTTAENLLSKFDLEKEQTVIVMFFMKILKQLFRGLCVEEKRGVQNLYRETIIEYDTNIWSSIYRICEMNRKRTDTQSKDAEKKNIHAHLLDGGYSSTDDYDRQLVFRFEGNQQRYENQRNQGNKSLLNQNQILRSIGGPQTISSEELIQNDLSSSSQSEQQEDQTENGPKDQSSKKVRFSINQEQAPKILNYVAKFQSGRSVNKIQSTNKQQNRPKSESNYKLKDQTENKLVNDESYSSDSSDQRPAGYSFTTGSIKQSNQDDSNNSSFIGTDETNLRQQEVAPQPEQDSQQVQEPQFIGLEGQIYSNINNDSTQTQFQDSKKIVSQAVIEQTLIQNQQNIEQHQNENQNRQQTEVSNTSKSGLGITFSGVLSRKDFDRTSNLKIKKETEQLEPIIETNYKITDFGLFLVMCTSVFILSDKLNDAKRLIALIKETKFPDQICYSNILKLHGLLLLLQKNYILAYEELEKAEERFRKFSQKGNLGVAHCLAVKSFIIYTKHQVFPQQFLKSRGLTDEIKLFKQQQINLKLAKNIYQEAGHLFGEYYCQQQLITKQLRDQKGLADMIAESVSLGSKIKQFEEQNRKEKVQTMWLKRYTCDETSLLIEIIDTKELGKPEIATQKFFKKSKPEKEKPDRKRRSKSKVNYEQRNSKVSDVLSSEDEVNQTKRQVNRKKADFNHLVEKTELQKERKRVAALKKEDAAQQYKQKLRPQSAKAPESQESTKENQIVFYQQKDLNYYQSDSVPFQWQIKTKEWKVLHFDLNNQLEEFYLQILNNMSKRNDIFTFEFKTDESTTATIQISLDPSQRKQQNKGIKTSLNCKNVQTGELYQISRFDKKCKKPKQNKTNQSRLKDNSQTKGEIGDEDPNHVNQQSDKSSRRSSFSKKSDSSSVNSKIKQEIDRNRNNYSEAQQFMDKIEEETNFEADDQFESAAVEEPQQLNRQSSIERFSDSIPSGVQEAGQYIKVGMNQLSNMFQENLQTISSTSDMVPSSQVTNYSNITKLVQDSSNTIKQQARVALSNSSKLATRIPSIVSTNYQKSKVQEEKNKPMLQIEETKGESELQNQASDIQNQNKSKKLQKLDSQQSKAKQTQLTVTRSMEIKRAIGLQKSGQQDSNQLQQTKSSNQAESQLKSNQK